MKTVDKAEVAKQKILTAAEFLFSENGFDGTSVDELAKQAEINKALLYYYFGSKENILLELCKSHMTDATTIVSETFLNGHGKEEMIENFIDKLESFLREKQHVIRIMMQEALKGKTKEAFLIDLLNPIFSLLVKKASELGFAITESTEDLFKIFSIYTAPLILYTVMGSGFESYYKMNADSARSIFFNTMKENLIQRYVPN